MINEIDKQKIKNLEEQLQKYKYDNLTGLLTRNDFEDYYNELKGTGETFYLTFVDINGLHEINRNSKKGGYDAGDELIKYVTYELKKSVAAPVFRIGGDEFAILSFEKPELPESDKYCFSIINSEKYITLKCMIKSADKEIQKLKKLFYEKNSRRK